MLDIKGRILRKERYALSEGRTTTTVERLPWGDAVTLKTSVLTDKDGRHTSLSQGVILRPNKTLRETSPKKTSHVIYNDAYQAFRGAHHAVSRYGIRVTADGTESGELVADVKTLREYVKLILRLGPHMAHVKADLDRAMQKLLDSYEPKRDPHKKRAKKHMRRGIKTKDSLGRDNPSAAGRSVGEAIEQLLERTENVQWLSMHMDQRGLQTLRLIDMHMEMFQELWDRFCKPDPRTITWHAGETIRDLTVFRDKLAEMQARPFVRNARHAVSDIERLLFEIMTGHNLNATHDFKLVTKLKNGLRWVFALHYLHMDVLFPLAETIERVKNQRRGKNRLKGKDGRKPAPINYADAPEVLTDLAHRLDEFRVKLDKCSDDLLEHGVKEQVLELFVMAQGHVLQDWRMVKMDLDAITELL